MGVMIRFDRVAKRYPPGIDALRDISFEIAEGELLVLAGHSGAGKSTVLKLIAAMERPSAGAVLVNGTAADQAFLVVKRVAGPRRHESSQLPLNSPLRQ